MKLRRLCGYFGFCVKRVPNLKNNNNNNNTMNLYNIYKIYIKGYLHLRCLSFLCFYNCIAFQVLNRYSRYSRVLWSWGASFGLSVFFNAKR